MTKRELQGWTITLLNCEGMRAQLLLKNEVSEATLLAGVGADVKDGALECAVARRSDGALCHTTQRLCFLQHFKEMF